ncbi:MAG: C10 family peptidase [Bacteroidota bacterium]
MDIFRRKIFYSIAYLATSLVLLSCTEKDNLLGNPTKTKSATKSSIIDFKVSEEEAIETLNGILNATYPSNTAIANFKRKEIGRIDYITDSNNGLRTINGNVPNTVDTFMYVINFKNDNGYALMSTDKRTYPIYALIDEGNYSPYNNNPGFNLFIKMAKVYFELTIQKDGLINEDQIINNNTEWVVTNKVGPKLQYKWDQLEPFNIYCPILNNGKHAAVGCTAVAAAMILAMNKKPSTINGYSLDWNLISQMKTVYDLEKNEAGRNQVATFLHELGKKMDMTYGEQSGAWPNDALKYMCDECNLWACNMKDYKAGDVASNYIIYHTLHNYPVGLVMMCGYTKNGYKKEGHTWVLDGQIFYKDKKHPDKKQMDLYHCNWGWGGFNDGYYLRFIFDEIAGKHTLGFDDGCTKFDINLQFTQIDGSPYK